MTNFSGSSRRRGAPSGNKNAVKHGFYTRQFLRADIRDLQNNQVIDLTDEIKLIRVYIRRVLEWHVPQGQDFNASHLDFPQSIELLRALSLASICMNRLIRTQHLLTPDPTAMDALHDALEQMVADMKEQGPD